MEPGTWGVGCEPGVLRVVAASLASWSYVRTHVLAGSLAPGVLAASLACCGCWLRVLAESRQLMGAMVIFHRTRKQAPVSRGLRSKEAPAVQKSRRQADVRFHHMRRERSLGNGPVLERNGYVRTYVWSYVTRAYVIVGIVSVG